MNRPNRASSRSKADLARGVHELIAEETRMKIMPKRFPALCAAAALVLCTMLAFLPDAEAKGRRGRKSAKRASSRVSRSARRRHLAPTFEHTKIANPTPVPDEIEVLEHGASTSRDLSKWLSPSTRSVSASFVAPGPASSTKRRAVNIDSTRVIQIQQALASRGYFQAEMTGAYDEVTIESMRRFQSDQKVASTGYPTAQSLRRLGLTSW